MPKITLISYGAAAEVTGSCHLLQIGSYKLLIDCGFFQGPEENYRRNLDDFPFDSRSINAVILTHAHLDHCGRLPRLYALGYQGPVYTTPPTAELTEIVLADNYQIMKEKSEKYQGAPAYSLLDLKKLKTNWQTIDYYQEHKLKPNISFKLYNAGHILGSAIVEIKAEDKTIIFSGDLGAKNMPLVQDRDYLDTADYLILESTYGDRDHLDSSEREKKLLTAVQQTVIKNSVLLISLFAIERTQDILAVLNNYYEKHLDFPVPVYLDSPMALAATHVYRRYQNYLNPRAQAELAVDKNIFNFPHLKITSEISESKNINLTTGPKIILAGSGMAEGGRIIHHLARYAPNPQNDILFMGYQVPGTLGYKLLNGATDFDYFGKIVPVEASVEPIDAFSAHAGQSELLDWLAHFKKQPLVFLNHGDKKILSDFSEKIQKTLSLSTQILLPRQTYSLN